MRLLYPVFALLLFFNVSCRVTAENMVGIYKPAKNSATRLILNNDSTFELALLDPLKDSLLFPGTAGQNFYTTGTWKISGRKRIILTPLRTPVKDKPAEAMDSIARFTNITSFNFWNRYGEPVSIRYIRIPPSKPKPHYGNSLYFFAQDFNTADTLKFYFDGYKPVNYPGTIPHAIGNNIHKITLIESYQSNAFAEFDLFAGKNRLSNKESGMVLQKRKF